MKMKLIMNWDIKPNMNQEYFEFVVREWVPKTSELGLQPVAAWFTVYSRENAPQIMAEALADNPQAIRDILQSPEWEDLQEKLQEYIENYSHKVVRMTGEFQL